MDNPVMYQSYPAAPDIEVLPAFFPIPGFGILPVNAFLIRASEPVLVDTGVAVLSEAFLDQLAGVIDLRDLRWLWLTHDDQDHIGSLQPLLQAAPELRIITTFLGAGKMSLFQPLPSERLYFLNPGQEIAVGDRTLLALKPPTYDAPETTGLYDPKSGALFSADCFGALLSEPALDAADIEPGRLKEGLITWTKADSPWLHTTDGRKFQEVLEAVGRLSPRVVLSCHLPPAYGLTTRLLEYLAAVPDQAPFVGPDQRALQKSIGNK